MNKKKLTTISQIIICIACIMGLSLVNSCNSKVDSSYKKTPADTTVTFVTFVVPNDWSQYGISPNQATTLQAWRLTKDTFDFTSVDTNTQTKTWLRDTTYAVQVNIPTMDSLNKPILDTSGKPKLQPIFPLLPKRYVLKDYNQNPNK